MTSEVTSQNDSNVPHHLPSPGGWEEPVEPWVGSGSPDIFTIFVVLPNEEVCTIRNLTSGIAVFDLKGRLELLSGIPSHLYALIYPDGEELPDHQHLQTQENIRDGYLLRMQLYDNWESLYVGISKNNIEHVFHSGGVHLRGNIVISQDESQRFDGVVKERASVALFMSSFLGLHRMVNMLLSIGIDVNTTTPFGRTPLHSAVAKDNTNVLDLLLNHGASFQQPDCFGVTPLDVAKEVCSTLCAKKLRIMQLNLRGSNGNTQRKQSPLAASRNSCDNTVTRSNNNIKARAGEGRATTVAETHRMRSSTSMSLVSDDSSFHIKAENEKPLHKSRKNISSSAPAKDGNGAISARDKRLLSSRASSRASTQQPVAKAKRMVTWKDIPTDNDYWEVIEYIPGERNNPQEAVNVKPMKIIHQKRILKFADGKASQTPNLSTESTFSSKLMGNSSPGSSRHSARLNKTSRKAVTSSELRSMRRKIGIAFNHGRPEEPPQNSEAFKKWLAKKSVEKAKAEESDSSDDSLAAESDEDIPKLNIFNKWVRKNNRVTQKGYTPGNRYISGLIDVGSTMEGDPRNPPEDEHLASHRLWQRSKAFGRTPIRRQTVQDFMSEKRKLEEKRKKLLLTAISYDEWMDNVEERKFLIQQILKADISDMKRLEEEQFKGRLGVNSFGNWKDRLKKREAEDRRRREIQRRYEEEQMMMRQGGRSSAAVPFEEWLKKKHSFFSSEGTKSASPRPKQSSQAEVDSAYESWMLKKHKQEMEEIEGHIHSGRKLHVHGDLSHKSVQSTAVA